MNLESRLLRVASLSLRCPSVGFDLFKRIVAVSSLVAETNTDKMIEDAIEEERSDEPPIEIIDADEDGSETPPEEDEDVEGFVGMPMGALPYKERRKGPRPQDVKPGRPDWWSSR